MTEWKDCSETPSASCSGILGRNQITHSLSRTLSSLAVYSKGGWLPFVSSKRRVRRGGGRLGAAWSRLRIRSKSLGIAFLLLHGQSTLIAFVPASTASSSFRYFAAHQVYDESPERGKGDSDTECRFQLLKSDSVLGSVR